LMAVSASTQEYFANECAESATESVYGKDCGAKCIRFHRDVQKQ
jgi:hypothetical protein